MISIYLHFQFCSSRETAYRLWKPCVLLFYWNMTPTPVTENTIRGWSLLQWVQGSVRFFDKIWRNYWPLLCFLCMCVLFYIYFMSENISNLFKYKIQFSRTTTEIGFYSQDIKISQSAGLEPSENLSKILKTLLASKTSIHWLPLFNSKDLLDVNFLQAHSVNWSVQSWILIINMKLSLSLSFIRILIKTNIIYLRRDV